ncbi:tetratricopeptide repeat-containing protein [Toxoplasma gondii TgCatPRC2]|uniref:DnaK family domain containing protein n=10 Tax=Toxoplasma gondii TaxID=5811 RepID=A0A125YRM9_TOXGV|nr:tetratricopeptide repeat-containing protein [Toxoplasma gondii ME49]EPR57708.1 tetratricopeptide repeat-containing protein [Toxoplasma gondii GT1]ESS29213.1 tetratricopeptide repeat-containing protein [Toxoplasma gondii VEG]KAF4646208.1 tetratricopeptide repeat-containing protein [Toxoplasma gondii]KFG37308.1 tetratricopeptide repeat-containing protein [Toxoplasma gondii GAB2-2007-GAL-DOM2]KFG46636.1 tetratricopeptide repeat-containing protein [Toxoplasma gondii FOU]KYK65821.1 tetratricope|eukprot:XP_002370259.2 tetratricopeptide repeat-containing protein [Toxoplasma gondii ME49]
MAPQHPAAAVSTADPAEKDATLEAAATGASACPRSAPTEQPSSAMHSRENTLGAQLFCCSGVDLGAQNSVLASADLAAPLAVDVEGNALSNRSTPSTEAFDGKLRLVGEEAEARATSNLRNTISHLPLWVAVKDEASLEKLKTRFPFSSFPAVSFDSRRREPVFTVAFDGESTQVGLTVVLAHFLKTVVSFAGTSRGRAVETRALAVALPSSFSTEEMSLVREACDLACLSRLVVPEVAESGDATDSDKNAAGEADGEKVDPTAGPLLLTRADALLNCWGCKHLPQVYAELPAGVCTPESGDEEGEVKFVALVDVGFAETSVQVAELRPRAEKDVNERQKIQDQIVMNRLSVVVDDALGTVDAINALATHVVGAVKTKYGEDVAPHSKRALRLFAGCQRAVKDLSGLPDTTLALEGFLQDEMDLVLPVSRDLFEQLCAPLKERLSSLVARAFATAGVAPAQVSGVDIVGGGSRIPFVAATLSASLWGNASDSARLRRTLDGNSSVAVGACFAASGRRYLPPFALPESRLADGALEALSARLEETEAKELARCAVRNAMESYLFQMQGALSGAHAHLFTDKEAIHSLLRQAEDWLLDHPDADTTAFETQFGALKAALEEQCRSYFEAVQREKEQKERELEEAARVAASNAQEDLDVKLPNSQCIKRAKKNKDEGNELFRDGNTEMAVQRYIKALQYTAKLFDLSPQDAAEATAVKLACNLNLAQAYLKLAASGDPKAPLSSTQETFLKKAVSCCDAALEADSNSLKAAYRRALANEKLRDFDAALEDVKRGLATSPADTDLLKLQDRLERQVKLQKEKAKKMYAKMFS